LRSPCSRSSDTAPSLSTYLATGIAVVVADSVSAFLVTAATALTGGTIAGTYIPWVLFGGAAESVVKALLTPAAVAALIHHNNLALITATAASATAYLAYQYSLSHALCASLLRHKPAGSAQTLDWLRTAWWVCRL
jgi:hypothetical protein